MVTKTGRAAANAERANQALQLRIGGATYQQIADQLKYASKGAAHNAVKHRLRDIPRENADELRQIEIDRLDAIQLRLMSALNRGDLRVVGDLLRLSERRARLLGLDKPDQLVLQAEVQLHDDQATLRMRSALEAAAARRDAALNELNEEARVLGLTMLPPAPIEGP